VAEALRARGRTFAESLPAKLQAGAAQALCADLTRRYWDALKPRPRSALRSCPVAVGKTTREGTDLAQEAAAFAATLSADQAAYFVGRMYMATLPAEYRSKLGVYYTPPDVAERLLDLLEAAGADWKTATVLDPACGGGAFLSPVARRMLQAVKGADPRIAARNVTARLRGFEIDPFAAWLSAVFLDATFLEELGRTAEDLSSIVETRDSLAGDHRPSFDVVVGNPPYGRVSLAAEARRPFARSLYGHANLYGIFLDVAIRLARKGGLVGFVTPTGFLCGEYFKNLRAVLGAEAPPRALEFVADRAGVFDDVLQETLLAVFGGSTRARSAGVSFAEFAPGGVVVTSAGRAPIPSPPEKPWIVARTPDGVRMAERLRSLSWRLADWGYGVSTGPLVWNRHKDQIRANSSPKDAVPLVWAESVSADGTFVFRAARRNHLPYFAPKAGDDWLMVRRPCVLVQRTTAKEQARRLIAAELPQSFLDSHGGQITIENHLNMIIPAQTGAAVPTGTLAAFLNSAAADRAFRCISGTVAVSAYELESLPLPAPWSRQSARNCSETDDDNVADLRAARAGAGTAPRDLP
jgi:adenine-specific DNA-methyltransferase